jgi:hypothetical protein
MSFDQRMMPHLHALAAVLLEKKMYCRLSTVASLLAGFSGGGWPRLGDGERAAFVTQMADDFHVRAWDDWDLGDTTLSTIRELIYAEQRALRPTA